MHYNKEQPMTEQNNEAIIGPSAKFSEHKAGDSICYRQRGMKKTGTITHVRAPGPVVAGGINHPTVYVVDSGGDNFPDMVYPGEIIQDAAEE
jgi:hypothetical protein